MAFSGEDLAKIWTLGFERTLKMQVSFSDLKYAAEMRVVGWNRFLSEIEVAMPWPVLAAEIDLSHSKPMNHRFARHAPIPIPRPY